MNDLEPEGDGAEIVTVPPHLPVAHRFSTGFQQVIHTFISTFKIKGFDKNPALSLHQEHGPCQALR